MGSILDGLGNIFGAGSGATRYQVNSGAFQPNQQEQDFANHLIQMSKGQAGPSLAETQMQQGLDQSNAQAQAMAASQRGINPGLAARLAAEAQSQNNMASNQQLGMLRAQEGMANNQMLGQELQSQRTGRMADQQMQMGAYEGAANRGANVLGTIGTGAALAMLNKGGVVPHYASGGPIGPMQTGAPLQVDPVTAFAQALGSQIGSMVGSGQKPGSMQSFQNALAQKKLGQKAQKPPQAQVSPFDQDFQAVDQAIAPGVQGQMTPAFSEALLAARGGQVPGQAQVPGNSPQNDTVPAVLSPGEIVLPRTIVAQGPDAARRFVEELMKRGRV